MAGKPRIPESEWDSICARYAEGEDSGSIAASYQMHRGAVYLILRRKGVVLEKRGGSPAISDAVNLLICDLYKQKQGASSIAKQFGIDKRSVYNILTRAGIGTRPRCNRKGDEYHLPAYQKSIIERVRLGHKRGPRGNFNGDAFLHLDEQACYWAGYLITDGWIGAYDGRSYRLGLLQARKHREQCEKLKAYLGSDLVITDCEKKTFGKLREFSSVSFTLPDEVAQRLLKLGIRPAKTTIAQAPACLLTNPTFWRGVVDGDGTCTSTLIRMNSSSCRLAGQYRRFLIKALNIDRRDIHIYRNQAGVWGLHTWGEAGMYIARCLYRDASITCRLERKYEKAVLCMRL